MNRSRFLVALVACATFGLAATPTVQAYINGGMWTSNYRDFPDKLRSDGWGVAISGGKHGYEPAGASTPDAKQMIVHALQDMPGSARDVSLEVRQELVAMAAKELYATDVRKGRIGNVEYRVGRYQFQNDPDTQNSQGARVARQLGLRSETGWMPIVALRLVKE